MNLTHRKILERRGRAKRPYRGPDPMPVGSIYHHDGTVEEVFDPERMRAEEDAYREKHQHGLDALKYCLEPDPRDRWRNRFIRALSKNPSQSPDPPPAGS